MPHLSFRKTKAASLPVAVLSLPAIARQIEEDAVILSEMRDRILTRKVIIEALNLEAFGAKLIADEMHHALECVEEGAEALEVVLSELV